MSNRWASVAWMLALVLCLTAPCRAEGKLSAASQCPPLPAPQGLIVPVSDEAALRDQALHAPNGATLWLAPGVYHMTSYLHITRSLALRGSSGQREDVVLDFGGMTDGYFGVLVEAHDVTLADLTIRNCTDHAVAIQGYDRPLLYNLHLVDAYDQLIKVNPLTGAGIGSEDGLLACCLIEYSTACPDNYTNGISAHDAHRWIVRDNIWRNIRGPQGEAGPTILFWSGSSDTIVERNLMIDCFRGVAFGNAGQEGLNHRGGVVRNNALSFRQPHDVAIEMVRAQGWLVAHNTALLLSPAQGLNWGMEARFESEGAFVNNLTNMAIWAGRDGASASMAGNLSEAHESWFVDAPAADLHLRADALAAIDQVTAPPLVRDDLDAQARPAGALADIGADEVEPSAMPIAWLRLPLIMR